MKFKKATPEYVFHCQVPNISPLLSPFIIYIFCCCCFTPMHCAQRVWNTTQPFSYAPPSRLHVLREFTTLAFTSATSFPQTHVLEKTPIPGAAAGLSVGGFVGGRAGYHVHLNKGSVFRQRELGDQLSSVALLSFVIMLALRLLHQDELSRTTCCLQSGCREQLAPKMN